MNDIQILDKLIKIGQQRGWRLTIHIPIFEIKVSVTMEKHTIHEFGHDEITGHPSEVLNYIIVHKWQEKPTGYGEWQ